jgi:uncharacterized membrane protein YadS
MPWTASNHQDVLIIAVFGEDAHSIPILLAGSGCIVCGDAAIAKMRTSSKARRIVAVMHESNARTKVIQN